MAYTSNATVVLTFEARNHECEFRVERMGEEACSVTTRKLAMRFDPTHTAAQRLELLERLQILDQVPWEDEKTVYVRADEQLVVDVLLAAMAQARFLETDHGSVRLDLAGQTWGYVVLPRLPTTSDGMTGEELSEQLAAVLAAPSVARLIRISIRM